MRGVTRRVVVGVGLALGVWCGAYLGAQTPLTPIAQLRGRTDSTGALLAVSSALQGVTTGLTPIGNLRGRTDSAGALLVTLGTTSTVSGALFRAGDGTSGAPAYSFTSEPTLGFWRSSAGNVTLQGNLTATNVTTTSNAIVGTRISVGAGATLIGSVANGNLIVMNNAQTIGVNLKADALPSIASGFGTSPAVTAGSTPVAGEINVGTGGTATSGIVNFAGTAYPSAPFCVATPSLTNVPTRTTSSTTQLTLTTTTAWTASDLVKWVCISSK